MAELPKLRDLNILIESPRSRVTAADVANPFQEIADMFGEMGTALENRQVEEAEKAGDVAVSRGTDGSLQIAENPFTGKAARTWERQASQGWNARQAIDIRTRGAELAAAAKGDPTIFAKSWGEYARGLRSATPAAMRPAMELELERANAQYQTGIIAARRERDVDADKAALDTALTMQLDDLAVLARNAGTSSTAYRDALSKARSLMDEKVANPNIVYSQSERDLDFRRLESVMASEAVVGAAERALEAGGPRVAMEMSEKILSDTSISLPPSTRREYSNLIRDRVSTWKSQRKADLAPSITESEDAITALKTGQRLDDPSIPKLVTTLRAGGAFEEANKLDGEWRVRRFIATLTGPNASVADRRDVLRQLTAPAPAPSPEAAGSRVLPIVKGDASGMGRLANPDLENVQPVLLDRFRQLQNAFGQSIPVVSGYRDPGRNRRAGGALRSRHIEGDALDLDVRNLSTDDRLRLIRQASAAGFTGIGVYTNSIHIDTGARRAWGPSHGRKSVPTWAEATIGEHLAGALAGEQGYAASGASTAGSTRRADPEAVKELRTLYTADMRREKETIKDGIRRNLEPEEGWQTFINDLSMLDDVDLRDEFLDTLKTEAGVDVYGAMPADQRAATREQLVAKMESEGASTAELRLLQGIDSDEKERTTALQSDPMQYSLDHYSQLAGKSPTPDPAMGADFAGALQARQRHALFVQSHEGIPPISILTQREKARLVQRLDAAPADAQAQVFAAMSANLGPATYMATMTDLAGNQSARAMAYAGALYQENPEAAEGVLRGRQLLRENARLAPSLEKADSRAGIDQVLPLSAVGPFMEATRQQMLEAATARYADLAHVAGDTSGEFNSERMEAAVNEVTGGILEWNNGVLIAPQYGMTQDEFDAVMGGLTDADLRGAVTSEGEPVTARELYRSGRLRSVGDGEYLLEFGSAGSPSYAARAFDPRSHSPTVFGGTFVLDLKRSPNRGLTEELPDITPTFWNAM